MNTIKAIAISLVVSTSFFATVSSHSATVTEKNTTLIRSSLIEQNLKQKHKLDEDDNLRLKTTLSAAPTQTFFATQNQRFSRFWQALFSS